MSQENVAVVRRMYDAFAKGDVQSVVGALDPKAEWWEAENFIYADGNPYVGPKSVLEGVFMRIIADWDDFVVSPKEILDAGETCIGHGYYSGVHKKSRRKIRAQFAHFFTLRDGKVVRFQQYADTAQFQRAVAS